MLGLYTHYFMGMTLVAHWVFLLWLAIRCGDRALLSRRWWAVNTVVLLSLLPWLPSVAQQIHRGLGALVLELDRGSLTRLLWQFAGWGDGGLEVPTLLWWGVPLALLAGVVVMSRGVLHSRPWVALLISVCVTPLLLTIAISFARPMLLSRYVLLCAVAGTVLAGIALDRFMSVRRLLARTVLLAWLLLSSVGLVQVHRQGQLFNSPVPHITAIDSVMAYVNEHICKGDALVANNRESFFSMVFYNHTAASVRLFSPLPRYDGLSMPGAPVSLYPQGDAVYLGAYNDLPAETRRFWLIGEQYELPTLTGPDSTWVVIGSHFWKDNFARLYLRVSDIPSVCSIADGTQLPR